MELFILALTMVVAMATVDVPERCERTRVRND